VAELLQLEEVQAYVGVEDDSDDALLLKLIDQALAAFYGAIGRTERPYNASEQLARQEIRDGTGSRQIWLDYPVKALTQLVTLGRDPAAWDQTLDPADVRVLNYKVGSRRLVRVDGGIFGCLDSPNYVRVTYDAQPDPVPEDVKLAFFRYIGALYRESGRAEASSERVLDDAAPLPFVADRDPTWQAAVANYLEPRL